MNRRSNIEQQMIVTNKASPLLYSALQIEEHVSSIWSFIISEVNDVQQAAIQTIFLIWKESYLNP